MREQYKKYEKELNKNDFIKKHYECKPFIGEKYDESRLLLIGESHYVPKNEVDYVDIDDYYDIPFDELKGNENKYKCWINTRIVFESRVYDRCDFKNFFSNPATEIAKVVYRTDNPSLDQRIEAMHQYAFINYFKRPSFEEGKTIRKLNETDYKYAYDITSYIINVLNPKLIIFLSKKAYYAFCEYDHDNKIMSKYTVKSVSHPSSHWWNRKRKDGKCAKDDFYSFVSEVL